MNRRDADEPQRHRGAEKICDDESLRLCASAVNAYKV